MVQLDGYSAGPMIPAEQDKHWVRRQCGAGERREGSASITPTVAAAVRRNSRARAEPLYPAPHGQQWLPWATGLAGRLKSATTPTPGPEGCREDT